MIYLKLFWDFFRVSCFTFGGAYGAIPLIRDMVLANGWLSDERITYMIAVSESTPGPIMVNMATYIGSEQAGFWGSVIATVGVVLPAYLVLLLIVALLRNVIKNKYIQAVLRGLKPCVVGIVLATGIYMILSNCFGSFAQVRAEPKVLVLTILLAAVLFGYKHFRKKKLSPIILIVISAVAGMVVYAA